MPERALRQLPAWEEDASVSNQSGRLSRKPLDYDEQSQEYDSLHDVGTDRS